MGWWVGGWVGGWECMCMCECSCACACVCVCMCVCVCVSECECECKCVCMCMCKCRCKETSSHQNVLPTSSCEASATIARARAFFVTRNSESSQKRPATAGTIDIDK